MRVPHPPAANGSSRVLRGAVGATLLAPPFTGSLLAGRLPGFAAAGEIRAFSERAFAAVEVLKSHPDAPLRVLIVWEPVLTTGGKDALKRIARAADRLPLEGCD